MCAEFIGTVDVCVDVRSTHEMSAGTAFAIVADRHCQVVIRTLKMKLY